jgi:hypothetical protein
MLREQRWTPTVRWTKRHDFFRRDAAFARLPREEFEHLRDPGC